MKEAGFSLSKDEEISKIIRQKAEKRASQQSKRREVLSEVFTAKLGEEKFEQYHFKNESSLLYADIYIPSRNVVVLVTDKNNT